VADILTNKACCSRQHRKSSLTHDFQAITGNRDNVIPLLQFLPEIRRAIHTTNAIASLNKVMRKFTRNRRIFPNDDAALKALFPAIRKTPKNWKSIHHWKPAPQHFQMMFGEDRVPLAVL
jgi:transposase-like protein